MNMTKYKAVVHYHFKNGVQNQGIQFLEKELIKNAENYGCHQIEILHSEEDPTHVIGLALWNDIEDARHFQAKWVTKEHELVSKLCIEPPRREFFKIASSYVEKSRRAA
jgi:quinol monooxygenase YgiN